MISHPECMLFISLLVFNGFLLSFSICEYSNNSSSVFSDFVNFLCAIRRYNVVLFVLGFFCLLLHCWEHTCMINLAPFSCAFLESEAHVSVFVFSFDVVFILSSRYLVYAEWTSSLLKAVRLPKIVLIEPQPSKDEKHKEHLKSQVEYKLTMPW